MSDQIIVIGNSIPKELVQTDDIILVESVAEIPDRVMSRGIHGKGRILLVNDSPYVAREMGRVLIASGMISEPLNAEVFPSPIKIEPRDIIPMPKFDWLAEDFPRTGRPRRNRKNSKQQAKSRRRNRR